MIRTNEDLSKYATVAVRMPAATSSPIQNQAQDTRYSILKNWTVDSATVRGAVQAGAHVRDLDVHQQLQGVPPVLEGQRAGVPERLHQRHGERAVVLLWPRGLRHHRLGRPAARPRPPDQVPPQRGGASHLRGRHRHRGLQGRRPRDHLRPRVPPRRPGADRHRRVLQEHGRRHRGPDRVHHG
eukprot:gene5567-biopygen3400